MSRPYIYGNSIYSSTLAFMSLFKDIEVRNYTSLSDQTAFNRRLSVDVTLDTKERIQYKLLAGGHAALEQADTRLPRIGVSISAINPDLDRYSGKNVKRILTKNLTGESGNNDISFDVQPFPVKIEFAVSIWAKYMQHYTQILENIIPHFDPYLTLVVKERALSINRDLKVELTNVGQSSIFELEGSQMRLIRGDMSFVVDTIVYKTLNENVKEIIEKVEVHVIDIASPISSDTISISADGNDVL